MVVVKAAVVATKIITRVSVFVHVTFIASSRIPRAHSIPLSPPHVSPAAGHFIRCVLVLPAFAAAHSKTSLQA
jgi:hypothetical protein